MAADWKVKIADFGFSRVKADNHTMTQCGTVAWTAPEIFDGSHYTVLSSSFSSFFFSLFSSFSSFSFLSFLFVHFFSFFLSFFVFILARFLFFFYFSLLLHSLIGKSWRVQLCCDFVGISFQKETLGRSSLHESHSNAWLWKNVCL